MYLPWKWLESYNNCTFSTKGQICIQFVILDPLYSICYFGSPIRFAYFMIMVGEELSCLPPWRSVIEFLSFRILDNLRLPWKTEFAQKLFTALKYFLSFKIFEELALALKTAFVMTSALYFIYFLHSGCLSNFCLPWKTECALNSLHWICIFIIQNFEQFALALKNKVALNIFTVLNIVFTFRIFEQLVLALKNRVCREFTVLNIYFLSFRILNNLRLPLKT